MTDQPVNGVDHVFTPYITIRTNPDGTDPKIIGVDWADSHREATPIIYTDDGVVPLIDDQLTQGDPVVEAACKWADERIATATAVLSAVFADGSTDPIRVMERIVAAAQAHATEQLMAAGAPEGQKRAIVTVDGTSADFQECWMVDVPAAVFDDDDAIGEVVFSGDGRFIHDTVTGNESNREVTSIDRGDS